MYLEGQASQRGYAMAALLMSVAVMAIVMSALLPVWRQQVQREKEAELVFRGEQYARAIHLFQRDNPGQYPPSVEVLVSGRYLRRLYKDPMTEDGEFQALLLGANQPAPQRGAGPQRGSQPSSQPIGGARGGGGIATVVSKSKQASIRIYRGGTHYNEWRFVYNGRMAGPGRGTGPAQGPGTVGPGRGASDPTVGGPRGGRPGGGDAGGSSPTRGRGPERSGGPGRAGRGGRGQ